MKAQEYLDELTEDLKSFAEVRNDNMKELDLIFKDKGAKSEEDVIKIIEQDLLSDTELNQYYDIAQLAADTNVICRKICDFIQFSRITEVDLNLEKLQEISGFNGFMTEYKPYITTFTVSPEKLVKETNTEQYNNNKAMFKKTLKNKNMLSFINESGN